jgi:SAM-dependent methyltransferase
MDIFDWANFAATTRDHEQHFLVETAEGLVPAQGQERNALDLGCGAGRGTKFLLARGWRVTAVDAEPAAIAIVSDIKSDKLRVVQSRFEDFEFGEEVYDLVSAQFSLPFTPRAELAGVVTRMKESIKPGGYFAGQFFGTHDEWNKPGSEVNFLTRDRVDELLAGMSLVEVIEDDKEGGTATGANKHWHVFHVIARKNSSE